jgi:hypothetical protein
MPMPSSRHRQDLVLDAARDQRVFDLQVGDRVHGMGLADGLGADFRQADVAHIAGLDHVGDGADRVLDRHVRVQARRAVDVDVVGAQALQAVGQEVLHRRGPAVMPIQPPPGRAGRRT